MIKYKFVSALGEREGRCQSVVTIKRSEDYRCGPGAAFCMLFMSFANCYGEHICDFLVMKETLGKSLCSATLCTLGCLPPLVGPALLCRGTSKLLFLPPLSVTFQNTSALGWQQKAEGGVSLSCVSLGKDLTSFEEQPTLPQDYNPFGGVTTLYPLFIFIFGLLHARGI